MPEGLRFVAGLPQGSLSASGLGELALRGFRGLRVERLRSEGGSPTIAIAKARRHQSEESCSLDPQLGRTDRGLLWSFPADGALLLVLPAPGNQIHAAPGTAALDPLLPRHRSGLCASGAALGARARVGPPRLPFAARRITGRRKASPPMSSPSLGAAGELSAEKVWGDLVRGSRRVCRGEATRASIGRHLGPDLLGRRLVRLLADVEIASAPGTASARGRAPAVVAQRGEHRGALASSAGAPKVGRPSRWGTGCLERACMRRWVPAAHEGGSRRPFPQARVALAAGVVELDDRARTLRAIAAQSLQHAEGPTGAVTLGHGCGNRTLSHLQSHRLTEGEVGSRIPSHKRSLA